MRSRTSFYAVQPATGVRTLRPRLGTKGWLQPSSSPRSSVLTDDSRSTATSEDRTAAAPRIQLPQRSLEEPRRDLATAASTPTPFAPRGAGLRARSLTQPPSRVPIIADRATLSAAAYRSTEVWFSTLGRSPLARPAALPQRRQPRPHHPYSTRSLAWRPLRVLRRVRAWVVTSCWSASMSVAVIWSRRRSPQASVRRVARIRAGAGASSGWSPMWT